MKRRIYRFCAVLFLLLFLSACAAAPPPEATAPPKSEPTQYTAEQSTEPTEEDTLYISSLIAAKTEDDLFSQSILVATGIIHDEHDVTQVTSDSGAQYNSTNYTFEISQIYRGSAENRVTVRVEGGAAGGRNEVYEPTADLKDGKEYLLFLYRPNLGDNYYVDDEAYYVLGLNQGTFEPADGGYASQSGAFLSEETLLARADEFPLDPDYFRREFLQNQQNNRNSGFITQEEYDQLIASIDVYAQIVETD